MQIATVEQKQIVIIYLNRSIFAAQVPLLIQEIMHYPWDV